MCLFSTLYCLHQPVCSAGFYQLTMPTSELPWTLSLSLSLSLFYFLPASSLLHSTHFREGQLLGFYVDLLCVILSRSELCPQCHWHTTTRSSVSIASELYLLVSFSPSPPFPVVTLMVPSSFRRITAVSKIQLLVVCTSLWVSSGWWECQCSWWPL